MLAFLYPYFAVVPSGVDEGALIDTLGDVAPQVVVQELARAKARDIAEVNPDAVVIGADTVVVVDGKILGKPADTEDASAMLTLLSGRTHEVYTGFAVVFGSDEEFGVDRTTVHFRNLTESEITEYVATGEPMDKAGAYGIQDRAISRLIRSLRLLQRHGASAGKTAPAAGAVSSGDRFRSRSTSPLAQTDDCFGNRVIFICAHECMVYIV